MCEYVCSVRRIICTHVHIQQKSHRTHVQKITQDNPSNSSLRQKTLKRERKFICKYACVRVCTKVMVQVLTSSEESKSGCTPEEAVPLARHLVDACPRLSLIGPLSLTHTHSLTHSLTHSHSRSNTPSSLSLLSLSLSISLLSLSLSLLSLLSLSFYLSICVSIYLFSLSLLSLSSGKHKIVFS